ncbi:unnamed protein product [Calypogeia fissa]
MLQSNPTKLVVEDRKGPLRATLVLLGWNVLELSKKNIRPSQLWFITPLVTVPRASGVGNVLIGPEALPYSGECLERSSPPTGGKDGPGGQPNGSRTFYRSSTDYRTSPELAVTACPCNMNRRHSQIRIWIVDLEIGGPQQKSVEVRTHDLAKWSPVRITMELDGTATTVSRNMTEKKDGRTAPFVQPATL